MKFEIKYILVFLFLVGCTQKTIKEKYPSTNSNQAIPQEETKNKFPLKKDSIEGHTATNDNRLQFTDHVSGSLSHSPSSDALDTDTLQLNFVNAPVADVARTIIAAALGRTLTIGNDISGNISLTSPKPVPYNVALKALEEVLTDSGFALIETEAGYLLTKTEIATERAQSIRRPGQFAVGYGVTVRPIQYSTSAEISRLIQPFLAQKMTVTTDDANNLIFLRGAQTDIDSALEAIDSFDTPWLTNKVFGLFQIKYTPIEDIIRDIETVYKTQGDSKLNSIKLSSLPRTNSVFVATNTRTQLKEIESWIQRFDVPITSPQSGFFFYSAQYKPAIELASSLNSLFGNQSSSPITSTSGQISNSDTRNLTNSVISDVTAIKSYKSEATSPGFNHITIIPDESSNALIIRANSNLIPDIQKLLAQMDQFTPQVLIEATIAEVVLTDDLRFGIQWSKIGNNSTISSTTTQNGSIGPEYPGLSWTNFTIDTRAAINTLSSITDVTILSAPSIVVQNNQLAQLQVGDQIPLITQQSQSTGDSDAPIISTVQQRDTGVILSVKPRVNASNMVSIEITQEVSDVAATTTSGIDSPTIQQRKLSSIVSIKSGETVALGGLIRETKTDSNTGIPGLMKIPILGNLFKSKDITTRRTELVVFITPRILREEEDNEGIINLLKEDMKTLNHRLKDMH